jgi:hypothetical protein
MATVLYIFLYVVLGVIVFVVGSVIYWTVRVVRAVRAMRKLDEIRMAFMFKRDMALDVKSNLYVKAQKIRSKLANLPDGEPYDKIRGTVNAVYEDIKELYNESAIYESDK